MMAVIPITSGQIKVDEYWQFRAHSVEWLYVLSKLKDSVMTQDGSHCLIGESPDGTVTYLLRKRSYSVATISKATGLSEADLESNVGIITLKEPKSNKGLPEPNVEGWGTA